MAESSNKLVEHWYWQSYRFRKLCCARVFVHYSFEAGNENEEMSEINGCGECRSLQ